MTLPRLLLPWRRALKRGIVSILNNSAAWWISITASYHRHLALFTLTCTTPCVRLVLHNLHEGSFRPPPPARQPPGRARQALTGIPGGGIGARLRIGAEALAYLHLTFQKVGSGTGSGTCAESELYQPLPAVYV